jgi:hypothetical protein
LFSNKHFMTILTRRPGYFSDLVLNSDQRKRVIELKIIKTE